MRVFKKGRGQRDPFSYVFGNFTGVGHSWKTRDVLITSKDELVWLQPGTPTDKLTDLDIQTRAREKVPLRGCTVTEISTERSIPPAVAFELGPAGDCMRFYTIEVTAADPAATTLTFGFVDKAMIEGLQDQIQNGIEHSTYEEPLAMAMGSNSQLAELLPKKQLKKSTKGENVTKAAGLATETDGGAPNMPTSSAYTSANSSDNSATAGGHRSL